MADNGLDGGIGMNGALSTTSQHTITGGTMVRGLPRQRIPDLPEGVLAVTGSEYGK